MTEACSHVKEIQKCTTDIAVMQSRIESGDKKFDEIKADLNNCNENIGNLSNALTQFTSIFERDLATHMTEEVTVQKEAAQLSKARYEETHAALKKLTAAVSKITEKYDEYEDTLKWSQGWHKFWKSAITKLGLAIFVGAGLWLAGLVAAELVN